MPCSIATRALSPGASPDKKGRSHSRQAARPQRQARRGSSSITPPRRAEYTVMVRLGERVPCQRGASFISHVLCTFLNRDAKECTNKGGEIEESCTCNEAGSGCQPHFSSRIPAQRELFFICHGFVALLAEGRDERCMQWTLRDFVHRSTVRMCNVLAHTESSAHRPACPDCHPRYG